MLQKRFVSEILDRALLSDQQRDLYRLLLKLVNQAYLFTMVKEKYLYKQALEECSRLERVEAAHRLGNTIPEEDLVVAIQQHTLE